MKIVGAFVENFAIYLFSIASTTFNKGRVYKEIT